MAISSPLAATALIDAGDPAAVGELSAAIGGILPSLETFIRFATPEQTAATRHHWSALLEQPLPEQGAGLPAVLSTLADVVIPNGLRAGDPGFSGWVATMPTTAPVAAHVAAAIAGPLAVGVQAFNVLESLALRWLAQLLGLPPTYQGLFTSGGSVANLIGLGAARQYAAEKQGLDVARDGVEALPQPRIYASTEVHHCVYRAAAVLGLGREAVVTLPADDAYRLDVAAVRRQLRRDRAAGCTPVAVVATSGTINTGAVDPLPDVAALCREEDVWLHVDGAYGALGVLDPEVAPLYGDLGAIDSLVVDPHKWLATSMGIGGLFVRDAALLARAFTLESAVYVEGSQPIYADGAPLASQFDDFGYAFHHFGLEHSLPSRGVEVWAVLEEIGAEGVRERVRRHNRFARHLAGRIRASSSLELMAPVVLSTCCFRFVPEELRGRADPEALETLNGLNRAILSRMRAGGRSMPSATVLRGAFVIRPCFINPRTTARDVDAVADEAERCGMELWSERRGHDGAW
jgi:aromatic-L-amino-acid decarboxylase